ncbi:hypothetical protein NQ315_000186 [Exocentrus adspersus]|uniref:Scavenger receptor class B member 1 n=1 Tax=Exocentrus adspersus TaxID=1586481 RepID=A0AAV8VRC6_9CUCU|nr:hypothetical protein NQ315_000186 [Exocentrus adspersus]
MIHPEVETPRDDDDVLQDFRHFQLEKNYNHLLLMGPALTRDFLEKVNADLVPRRTYLFGYELNTKKILFVSGLFLLFFTSLFGAVVMWFTDFFDNAVLSTMVISNSSKNLRLWTNPPPKALISVYIFNYTNLEEFDAKLEKKLRVNEVGPYVYEETLQKVNVQFSEDGTRVSYQEKRSYKFRPDMSKGKQSDQVYVPNIPLMAGTAITKHHNYFARLAFSSFLTGIDEQPFVKLAADQYIIGYRNRLVDLSQSWSWLNGQDMHGVEKVGLLSAKIGVNPHVFTMNTGKADIDRLGLIEKLNGHEQFDYWSTSDCNRYVSSDAIYASAEEKSENQCFCSLSSGECPLRGVFNVTPCNYGIPMFISNPHFHGADETLLQAVDGLKTMRKKDIQTYINLHPTMGFAMSGRVVFQANIQVQKAYGVYQMDRFQDGLMLPLAWLKAEIKEESLPEIFLELIYDATYTLKGVKMAFQYGFLLTTLVTLFCLVLVLRNTWERPRRARDSVRRLHRQDTDVIEI